MQTRKSLSATTVQVVGMVETKSRKWKHIARAKHSFWEKQKMRWKVDQGHPTEGPNMPCRAYLLNPLCLPSESSLDASQPQKNNPTKKRAKDLNRHSKKVYS